MSHLMELCSGKFIDSSLRDANLEQKIVKVPSSSMKHFKQDLTKLTPQKFSVFESLFCCDMFT